MAKKTQQRRFLTRTPPSSSATPEEEEEEREGEESFIEDEEEERRIPSSFGSYGVTNEERDVDEEENADGEYDDGDTGATAPADSTSYTRPSQLPTVYSTTSFTNPPPSNYVNVAPLPIFRGVPDECPVEHLSRFYRVCRANNATTADMVARIFPVTLEDEAARWYELTVQPDDPSISVAWAETKSLFLETYRRPERYRSELMTIKQKEEESVSSYHLRMQWILKKWPEHGIPDEILRVVFVDGMRWEECQDWVVLQRPNSVAEAFGLALSWERAESIRLMRRRKEASAGGGGSLRCGFCDGEHEESGCETRSKMRELWRTTKGGSSEVQGVVRNIEGAGGGGDGKAVVGDGGSKRSQCMCWKHRCWKKLDRCVTAPATRAPPPPPSPSSPPLLE